MFARALASFLPPEVAELVEASPSALSLREEVEATILFSDIRGFSSLAERLPPREVIDVVERHLEAMVEVVTSNGGVLDKFAYLKIALALVLVFIGGKMIAEPWLHISVGVSLGIVMGMLATAVIASLLVKPKKPVEAK